MALRVRAARPRHFFCLSAVAKLVKRFAGLPPAALPFCSHRNVGQRCDPMTCRPHGEAVRVRKRWPGSAEGTSCAAAEDAQSIVRPASGFSVQHLPTRNGRVSQRHSAAALCCLFFWPSYRFGAASWRRGGPQGGPNGFGPVRCQHRDVLSANPGASLRTRTALSCGRQVIGSHLWPTFLCEEKGGAAGGSPAKRLTS